MFLDQLGCLKSQFGPEKLHVIVSMLRDLSFGSDGKAPLIIHSLTFASSIVSNLHYREATVSITLLYY